MDGDVILLDPGAHVPADARLLETIALRVEEAALTGESLPVASALCSDAVIEQGSPVGDPTEVALVLAATEAGIDVAALRQSHRKVLEVPFDPSTRHMITVHETPTASDWRRRSVQSLVRVRLRHA